MQPLKLTNTQVVCEDSCLVEPESYHDPTRPTVVYYPNLKTWRLIDDYAYFIDPHELNIPAPFDFDLASIPRPLWVMLASHELGIIAPLCHDYLYRSGGNPGTIRPKRSYTRAEADQLFLRQMKEDGVGVLRRRIAYHAVRFFGRKAWQG